MHLLEAGQATTNEKETGLRAKMSGKQEEARTVRCLFVDQSASKDSRSLPKKALGSLILLSFFQSAGKGERHVRPPAL